MMTYARLEKSDKKNYNFRCRAMESRRLAYLPRQIAGRYSVPQRHSSLFPAEDRAPWFAYWLHDGTLLVKEATTFRPGATLDFV
jgi:hypothetical protein